MNVDALKFVEWYVSSQLRLDPIMIDGQPSWVFLISDRVAAYLTNPTVSGSLGEFFAKVADYRDPERLSLPGEMGRAGGLVLCKNFRAPTITVGGSNGAWTILPGFMQPGNNDDRNNAAWANTSGATNYVFDINMVLGANAIAEYQADPLNTNLHESTHYCQVQGQAAYLGECMQIPLFDKDSGSRTATSIVQRGSCIVPTGRKPIVTVAS
jgi:hypothetical protein